MASSLEADQGSNDNLDTNGTVSEEQLEESPATAEESPASSAQSQVQQTSGSPVGGPRHAPNYTVVNAILEKKEDGPGPRCGHTLTAVAAVGEEGTPNYMGPRLILFGGATALEGNSANAGTPTSAGGAGIRMFLAPFSLIRTLVIYI